METNEQLKQKIIGLKDTLPGVILADHFRKRPDLEAVYTPRQRFNYQNDIVWILSFLAESVWAGQPALFEEFVSWLKTFLLSVRVPEKDVRESLEMLKVRIMDHCTPEENSEIERFFNLSMRQFSAGDEKVSIPATETFLTPLAKSYLNHLLQTGRNAAMSLIMNEVAAGKAIKDIYTEIFQPVQYEIGRLWQTNQISVAQEHYCTGSTQLVMSQLYPYLFSGEKRPRKMVATCVPGELHEIGARMVADFFEMEGWDTYYLGANMPVDGVCKFVVEQQPQLLAISATMTYHINLVAEMIHQARTTRAIPESMKIIVGGYPFRVVDTLWQQVDADGYALNAQDAIITANKILHLDP